MSRRRVITERDIRRAKADGRTSVDVGDAVVTPSAREVAATLRVALGGAKAAPREPSAARRPPGSRGGKARDPDKGTPGSSRRAPVEARNAAPATVQGRSSGGGTPDPSQPVRAGGGGLAAGKSLPSIAIGSDHGGVGLKAAIAKRLRDLGHDVSDVGTNSMDPVDYPDLAESVARMVGEGRAAFGIMIDGAGIGSCMAANKVARVRAAMCYDITTATNAREHNFANVLTLGAGLIGERLAIAIVETFLSTPTGAERHAARVAKIDALDRRG